MSSIDYMSPDLIRFALVVGMIASVFLYEKSHLTTGSIVVPGFLGIHIFEPLVVIVCLLNATLCFWLVHRFLPRLFFMTNQTKFQLLLTASVMIQMTWQMLSCVQLPVALAGSLMAGLGCVVPGLIAHDMSRNGATKTALNSLLISLLVGAFVYLMLVLAPQQSLAAQTLRAPFYYHLVLLLTLSTIGSLAIRANTKLRSGGYVTSAYFVLFANNLDLILLILGTALATYVFVVFILIPRMIIFGRRKFALMLIVGSLIAWVSLKLCVDHRWICSTYASQPSYAGILLLLPGLIANEIQRSSLPRVTAGMITASCWTYSSCSLLYELYFAARPDHVLPHLAVLAVAGTGLALSRFAFSCRKTFSLQPGSRLGTDSSHSLESGGTT